MPSFRFKQFTIRQDRCAMKVGTDGVLLGAWADVDGKKQLLDVGTGTGLIALMMAQRNAEAKIWGIDVDDAAVEQARENRDECPWTDRIAILNCDFCYPFVLEDYQFDAIVSNPPFYKAQVYAPDSQRDMARRSEVLPMDQLMRNAANLLSPDGSLSLILPFADVNDAVGEAAVNGLYLKRRCDVVTTEGKSPKRSLLEFSKIIEPAVVSFITIYDKNHQYTDEFRRLTEPFYL